MNLVAPGSLHRTLIAVCNSKQAHICTPPSVSAVVPALCMSNAARAWELLCLGRGSHAMYTAQATKFSSAHVFHLLPANLSPIREK